MSEKIYPDSKLTIAMKAVNARYNVQIGIPLFVPDFTNSKRECTLDDLDIMSTVHGDYICYGILENTTVDAFCIFKVVSNGLLLVDAHCTTAMLGKKYAAITLLAVSGKLKNSIVIDESTSATARQLLTKLMGYRRFTTVSGLLVEQVDSMTIAELSMEVFNGHEIDQPLFREDFRLHPMWFIRSMANEDYD